jgi:SAM-dependent MidA family methyltransferase
MSAADGSEQGKSDRATIFEESKRLLAKQKELLQQVKPCLFSVSFSKSQSMLSFCQSFSE